MLINITGINCKPEVVTYLNKTATPNEIIPEYWSKDVTTMEDLFDLADTLDDLSMASIITKSFNLRAGTRIPSIHLYNKE